MPAISQRWRLRSFLGCLLWLSRRQIRKRPMESSSSEENVPGLTPADMTKEDSVKRRRSPRWLPSWYWLMAIVAVGFAVYVRLPAEYLPPHMQDNAVANIVNVAAVLLLFLSWAIWLALFSRHPMRTRWLPLGIFALLVAVGMMTLKVDEVWGGLIPYRLSWRWSAARDYGLEPLKYPTTSLDDRLGLSRFPGSVAPERSRAFTA
jgi:hypothetical protein